MVTTPLETEIGSTCGGSAGQNRELLAHAGIFAVQLCGSPGCGKTSLIQATLQRLRGRANVGVIVAHLAAERDAAALKYAGAHAMSLDVSHLDPSLLHDALARMVIESQRMDFLLIENAGETFDAHAEDLGQSVRAAVFSTTGGHDKAAEFPWRVEDAELILLTKIDLLPHVRFDLEVFRADVHRINPAAKIIELSSADCGGMDLWVDWLMARTLQTKLARQTQIECDCPEWWFG